MTSRASTPRITYGGWFPRTTLHLREIFQLFSNGVSELPLDQNLLSNHQRSLSLASVTRQASNLEYVEAKTTNGIEIRYYEDGLFTLSIESRDIASSQQLLQQYYETQLKPAISFIFSLGAPTPKVLANIHTAHPTAIALSIAASAKTVEESVSEHIYERVSADHITLYKTKNYFLVVGKGVNDETLRELVEMQIFFREFKDQLAHYLNIHRSIWEEIEKIKEQQFFRGRDIEPIRTRLDGYQKTINLISNRIEQMGSYVETRKSIASKVKIEEVLSVLFQYKFEILLNTLSYIEEIWEMTENYLTSAIQVVNEVQAQSTTSSIDSLRTITTVGVISGLLGYLASSQLPSITATGVQYFTLLIVITLIINSLIGVVNRRRKYQVTISETELKI